MTNEQILEKQVEALEKLLQLKEAVIQELEAKIARMQYPTYPGIPLYGQGGISIPSVWTYQATCPDGSQHTFGTSNTCTKCGAASMGGGSVITSAFTNPNQGIAGQGGAAGGLAGQVGGGYGGAGGTTYQGPLSGSVATMSVDGISQTVTTAAVPSTHTINNNVFALASTASK